jgi:DNA-binding NarL/FixJ family response regulator
MIRVLIADDHATVREGLRYLLDAQQDIEVIGVVENGRQAVDQAMALKPDVVVMDIAMPELNGIEAAKQIRQASPPTQIVILSMYATQEHVLRALQSGARGYLMKETAGEEVADAVREVHSGSRHLSERIADLVVESYIQMQQGDTVGSPLDQLSAREREILQLVVEGKSNKDIAGSLFLSPKTVDTYRSRAMTKLGVNNLPDLVKLAIQYGLITLE